MRACVCVHACICVYVSVPMQLSTLCYAYFVAKTVIDTATKLQDAGILIRVAVGDKQQ